MNAPFVPPGSDRRREFDNLSNTQAAEPVSKKLEGFIAWASVSYGAGFLTVMVHTASLGMPVAQIIEPVNIWVGAPVALFLFLAFRFIGAVKTRAIAFGAAIDNAPSSGHIKTTLAAIWSTLLRNGPRLMLAALMSNNTAMFRIVLDAISQLSPATDGPGQHEADARRLTYALLREGFRFVASLALYVLIPSAVACYVLVVYPRIPQRLGGARPAIVSMQLEAEKVPREALGLLGESNPAAVTLILRTDEKYFVRNAANPSGPIVELGKEAVTAVVWNSAADSDHPRALERTGSRMKDFKAIASDGRLGGCLGVANSSVCAAHCRPQ